ncbi:MAG TPA: hypothetical protein VJZ99_03350 [Patescibacteria group bacterium]|nr:hypothetical protein [Patescibacteria group bacterium]
MIWITITLIILNKLLGEKRQKNINETLSAPRFQKLRIKNPKRVPAPQEIFSWIDSKFQAWDWQEDFFIIYEEYYKVYNLKHVARAHEMVESLKEGDLRSLSLSPAEFLIFCQKYLKYIRQKSFGVFFLVEKDSELYFILVETSSKDPAIILYPYDYFNRWNHRYGYRLVLRDPISLKK